MTAILDPLKATVPAAFIARLDRALYQNFATVPTLFTERKHAISIKIAKQAIRTLDSAYTNQPDDSVLAIIALLLWDDLDAHPFSISKDEALAVWRLTEALHDDELGDDETDDDPRCVCGTHRSEHALCGCGDWQRA